MKQQYQLAFKKLKSLKEIINGNTDYKSHNNKTFTSATFTTINKTK